MFCNFTNTGAVFFRGQVSGEFLVGDFVAAVLEMGEAGEDGHGGLHWGNCERGDAG
jgi:hypothetical protein